MNKVFSIFLFLLIISCSTPKEQNIERSGQVAISRFQIEGGKSLSEFLSKVENEIKIAKNKKAKYLLFPELPVLDLYSKNPMDVKKEIDLGVSKASQVLKAVEKFAKDYEIYLVGFSQYVRVNKKIKNRAYVFGPKGVIGFQDKIYPTPWELEHHISKGENQIKKFQTDDFSFVILICHDAEFPNLSSRLNKISPEVIFVPSQTDTLQGRNRVLFTARARAIENMSYVFVAGDTSFPKAKWHTYQGGAAAFYPQNKYFKAGGEEVLNEGDPVLFQFNKEMLRKSRLDKSQVYPLRDM